jgi:hypothetical protein
MKPYCTENRLRRQWIFVSSEKIYLTLYAKSRSLPSISVTQVRTIRNGGPEANPVWLQPVDGYLGISHSRPDHQETLLPVQASSCFLDRAISMS